MKEVEGSEPSISILWDEQTQGIVFQFDKKQMRSWDMILNVLETAKRHATDQRAFALAAHMHKQAVEQQQGNAIRRNLGM